MVINHLFGDQKNPLIKVIDTPGFINTYDMGNNTIDAILEMLE
jgi:hypothetical protein